MPDNEALQFSLGRLEGKLDMVLAGQIKAEQDYKDIGARLNKLESELVALKAERGTVKSWTSGAWAVATSVFAMILSTISTFTSIMNK